MKKGKCGFYCRYIKRLLDFVLSLLALIVLGIPMLIVAILIKFKIGRPVLYVHDRPGRDGKVFRLYKFRTMNKKKNEDGILLPDVQRLTPLGRKLRNLSIDELPELINIVKGDMSIIGPRPLLVKYLSLYNEEQKHRHDVLPGLTGLAQVHGRNMSTWEQRFKYDVEYVNKVCFRMDVEILIATIKSVFRHEGINSQETSIFTMSEFAGTKSVEE